MRFSNKQYDILKWIVGLLLPALSAFYAALAVLWGLPAGVQVSGSLGALAALLGALMGQSTKKFNEDAVDPELYEGE